MGFAVFIMVRESILPRLVLVWREEEVRSWEGGEEEERQAEPYLISDDF